GEKKKKGGEKKKRGGKFFFFFLNTYVYMYICLDKKKKSGAGKTTLMKIISGQLRPSEGELYYEGKTRGNEANDMDPLGYSGNAAVVDQNEHLLGSLTVRDTIRYAAMFKMIDESVIIEQRVDHILQYLGLSHCANVKIGTVFQKGISGGEKRRVAIGAELVTQPALLFLDEVTSGLDATSAYAVMNVAHKLAELNHTVIMTIHQ
ncbi:abc transporter family protein, partial [Reticulomyxa filosa]